MSALIEYNGHGNAAVGTLNIINGKVCWADHDLLAPFGKPGRVTREDCNFDGQTPGAFMRTDGTGHGAGYYYFSKAKPEEDRNLRNELRGEGGGV